jgi:predicted permease
LMLLTLGVAIARLAPGHLGRSVVLSLAKSVVCAAVAAGVGYWVGLPPVAHAVLILQFITPVAVTSYLLSERYQSDPSAVAGLVMVSTLLSVITIPLALAFLV